MPCCIKDGKPGKINPKTKECEEECDCDPSDPMSPKGVKVMFTLILYAMKFHITNAGVNLRIFPYKKAKIKSIYTCLFPHFIIYTSFLISSDYSMLKVQLFNISMCMTTTPLTLSIFLHR